MEKSPDFLLASMYSGAIIGGMVGCYLAPETLSSSKDTNKEYVEKICHNLINRSYATLYGAFLGLGAGPIIIFTSPITIPFLLYKRYF